MEERFNVRGKVQGVFFRKSFAFILNQRGLKGGATNNKAHKNLVHCSVSGEALACQKLKEDLLSCPKLNSLGAHVEALEEVDHGIEINDHDATSADNPKLPFGLKVFL